MVNTPDAPRTNYKFHLLKNRKILKITVSDRKTCDRARKAAHVFAARHGWMVRTSIDRAGRVLTVARTDDADQVLPQTRDVLEARRAARAARLGRIQEQRERRRNDR